jgi:hypothetical protein
MHTPFAICLAATALVAQSNTVVDPRFAGVLEPDAAAQFLLPIHGFATAQLAYAPVPHPALRVGATTVYAPDPLLCSASYAGAEVAQFVFAMPQGAIVLLETSPTLALYVLTVPTSTWSLPAGICIDGRHDQVVLLDAAGPRFLRIDLADLRAGNAQFQTTPLPSAWSTVRRIALDLARDRIIGFQPATGELLQRSANDPNPSGGMLRPMPEVLAFGFAPTGGLGHDLFVSSGGQRLLTSQWTWHCSGLDGGPTATLRATVATSAWSPPSPDPSGIGYDDVRDQLMVSDGEVEEMTIYAGKNVWEASRTGVVSRSTTTLAYTTEPVGMAFQSATRTFYISDDTTPDAVHVVAVGPDGLLNSADDTRRSFDVGNFPTDPEDTAFDNARNELWVAGGILNTVHRLRPGPNGIFDGIPPVGDDQILTIGVSAFGVTDVECIAVRPLDGGIYVVGQPITTLLHLDNTGQFVRTIDLPPTGLIKPAGIVFAPRSSGSGDSMYLVDRGIDNAVDPNENDGMLFEYEVPVTGVNQPPVVDAGPDVTILPSAAANLAGSATDDGLPGPLTIQWSQLSGPGTTTFAAPNQAATTATFSAVGSYTLQLSAFDGQFTTTDTCVVTVQQSGNQPPVVDAGPDVTTAITSTAHLAGSATDDGLPGPLTIQWSQLSGPGTTTFAAPNRAATTATFSAVGSYTLQLSAFDGQFTTTDTCMVTVQQSGNQPPVVDAGPDVTTAITSTAHLAGSASDDGLPGPLTIQWSQLSGPGTTTFAAPNRAATTATFSAPGSYMLELSAFDGEFTSLDQCVVTVQANQPPLVMAGPDVTVLLTAAANLAGTASDDGLPGPLTIQWSQLSGPGTTTFAEPNRAATTATFSAPGSYMLELSAFDGEFTSLDQCVVTVQANQPPLVMAGPDVTVLLTAAANLAGTASDDGLPGPLTIQWSQLSGPGTTTFAEPNRAATTATFSAPGSYMLELSAFDGEFTSLDQCVVTVQAGNQPPTVSAGPDVHTTITSLTTHLAGQVADDGLPGPLTIQWSQLSGPGLALFTAPTQPVTDVVLVGLGTYVFELSASDGQYTSLDQCVVTVTLF